MLTVDPLGFDRKVASQTLSLMYDVQGRLKERIGDLDGAENSYKASITAHQSRTAYARLGVFLMASRKLPSVALQAFDKANQFEGQPEYTGVDAIVSYYRGIALEQLGDMAGAERVYRELIQNNPGGELIGLSAQASLELGKIYAEQSLTDRSENNPLRPLGYFQRAIDSPCSHVRTRLDAYKCCAWYLLKKNLLLVEAEKMLCKMIGLARQKSEPNFLREGYAMYSMIYSANGHTKEADYLSKSAKAIGEG
jgi:tetratricopeptide (TPR) repeat protein